MLPGFAWVFGACLLGLLVIGVTVSARLCCCAGVWLLLYAGIRFNSVVYAGCLFTWFIICVVAWVC